MTDLIKIDRNGSESVQLNQSTQQTMRFNSCESQKLTPNMRTVSLDDDVMMRKDDKYVQLDKKSIPAAGTTDDDHLTVQSVSFHRSTFDVSGTSQRKSMNLSQPCVYKARRRNSIVTSNQNNSSSNMSISTLDLNRANRRQSRTVENNSNDNLTISLCSRSERSMQWLSLTEDDDFFVDPLCISRGSLRLSELPREIEFSESDDEYFVDPLAISKGSLRIRDLPREIKFSDDSESCGDSESCDDFYDDLP